MYRKVLGRSTSINSVNGVPSAAPASNKLRRWASQHRPRHPCVCRRMSTVRHDIYVDIFLEMTWLSCLMPEGVFDRLRANLVKIVVRRSRGGVDNRHI